VWDALADWWDDTIGGGNTTQDLAALGAEIVAFDHSERFIARARQNTPPQLASLIDYRVLNAHDTSALLALGAGRFDAAVCTMALMDMATITPLLSAVPRLLKPDGEQVLRERRVAIEVSMKVTDYLTPRMERGIGVSGQPVEQHYFHRPLSVLLNACFDCGLVLDRLEEPALPANSDPADQRTLSWRNIHLLPQTLTARLRPRR